MWINQGQLELGSYTDIKWYQVWDQMLSWKGLAYPFSTFKNEMKSIWNKHWKVITKVSVTCLTTSRSV